MKNTEMYDDVDAEEGATGGGTGNIFGDIGRHNISLNDSIHSSNFSSINNISSTTTTNTANNNNNTATINANLHNKV